MRGRLIVLVSAAAALAAPVLAAPSPTHVGQCVTATVKDVGSRLQGDPSSGSALSYMNGVAQVSYDVIPGIAASRSGDQVKLCLVSLPKDCPPGDDRGKVYKATNLRTGKTWSAPDSEHSCGGA